MKKVAAYIRVSTTEQAEHGVSIPMQKSRALAYIQSKGDWELFDCYLDDGYSGKDLNRPEIKRLISDATRKMFDIVLVIKLDRLSRKQRDIMYLLDDIMKPNGIEFASISENFDTTTPMGRAMFGIMAVFAQLEREIIVERVTDAKKETAKQGKFMGGPIPIGYKYDYESKTLTIDEVRAATVRWIFKEYVKGLSGISYIVQTLNSNSVPPPGEALFWRESTVKQIIKNHFFAGYIEHKGELFKAQHPPIIALEEFDSAQNLRKIRTNANPDKVVGLQGLLKGLLICGECGAKIRQKTILQNPRDIKRSKKALYYVCYSTDKSAISLIRNPDCPCGYHRAEKLEERVIAEILRYKENPRDLMWAIAEQTLSKDDIKQLKKDMELSTKELENIKRKLNRWDLAYEDGTIDSKEYREKTYALKNRRTILLENIERCEEISNAQKTKINTVDILLEQMDKLNELWDNATFDEKREMLIGLVKQVKVFKGGNVEINFF